MLWLCSLDRLPTKKYLHHIGVTANPLCPICNTEDKTPKHIFISCHVAQKFWLDLGININNLPLTQSHWLIDLKEYPFPMGQNLYNWLDLLPFAL